MPSITDLLFGNSGGGVSRPLNPAQSMMQTIMSSGGGNVGTAYDPGTGAGSGMGPSNPFGGGGAMGGMDWDQIMQMMSRMGGMGGPTSIGGGGPMTGMGAGGQSGFATSPTMPASNFGGSAGMSPILQAMQAAISGMRGGAQPNRLAGPINSMMRYR